LSLACEVSSALDIERRCMKKVKLWQVLRLTGDLYEQQLQ